MNENTIVDVKNDFREYLKSNFHQNLTHPASKKLLLATIDHFKNKYKDDKQVVLNDVDDFIKREHNNHKHLEENSDDLVLIKTNDDHLHIASNDDAVRYFIDGHIKL